MNTRSLRLVFLGSLAGFVAGVPPVWARTKTDILHMKNGDKITCEIKRMEHGQLLVKTDYTKGTLTINWEKIGRIESKQLFVLETEQGNYYSGEIRTDAKESQNVDVTLGGTQTVLRQRMVVTMEQLGRGFIGRMKGAVDYGFSFARSNKQTQSTLHLDLNSRSEETYTTFAADSLFSTTGGVETNRHSASTSYSHRLGSSNWSLTAFGVALSSGQQQLDLRTTFGGGVERRFIYTNRNYLIGAAGVVYTKEKFSQAVNGQNHFNSAEGALGVKYSTFRFDSTEWINTLWVYPSMTTRGRVRSTFDSSLYLDLVGDLYFRLGVYHTYDSQPPTDTPKSDYGITTSIGWSF
jgi:putative salt-induced outer membrane protein YdiY